MIGMTRKMTKDEWQRFLSEGSKTGKLATVRADGRPHVVPVWFLLDGDDLLFMVSKESVKGRNLLRDGRAALCVDSEVMPYRYATAEGRVEVNEDADDLRRSATLIAARYVGEEAAEKLGALGGGPGAMVVRMRIERVVAEADISD
ncbi:PPOX class F420-dependent oxidoreductase [Streptomyces sp. NPDC003077]|uniref:PPOX class F420-dependent oxidoreductase n=1 Tax=Streptomyces sp. NPDC003077 TaxID=3154443 RepID=UPI0033A6BDCF